MPRQRLKLIGQSQRAQEPPTDLLGTLVEATTKRRTGELVVVVETREFHVYFREGLIAWAADSAEPAQFSRVIKQVCSIDDDAFTEVVNECRRSRLPLGETLVNLGMACREQVREALLSQARRVVEVVSGLSGGSYMFLERPTYLKYRFDFAFALEELLSGLPVAAPATSPDVPHDDPSRRLPEKAEKSSQSLIEALGRLADFSWVALSDDVRLLEHQGGPVGEPAVLPAICRALNVSRADFLAFRGHRGALIGARCSDSSWVWCRVNRAGAFAQVTSAYAAHGLTPTGQEHEGGGALAPLWRKGSPSPLLPILEETLHLAPVLLAILVEAGAPAARWALGRPDTSLEDLDRRIAGAAPLFAALSGLTDGVGNAVAGGSEHLVVSADEGVLFGAREERAGQWVSAWTWGHRNCSIGLGLASLTLVLRRTDVE